MQIKICGITNIEDAILCAELGADALGFIFYKKSKRFIAFERAYEIIRELPPFIFKVGVFVDEDLETVNNSINISGLNAVQLHGDETPEYVENICSPVIKSFRVNKNFNWDATGKYQNCKILLDSFSESGMGGTGNKFDWGFIPTELRSKIILSGGVSINNMEEIFRGVKPAAIDLSSSLESEPGRKDHQKVKEFFKRFNQLRNE